MTSLGFRKCKLAAKNLAGASAVTKFAASPAIWYDQRPLQILRIRNDFDPSADLSVYKVSSDHYKCAMCKGSMAISYA